MHTGSDAFVQADDTVAIRLRRGKGASERLIVLDGDTDLLIDLAHQLLGAAQVVRERRAARAQVGRRK